MGFIKFMNTKSFAIAGTGLILALPTFFGGRHSEEKDETVKSIEPGSKWCNELGSVMKITDVHQATGSFTGTYNSAVGEATKTYKLCGRFDTQGSSLGWVVSWKNDHMNAHSTTAWSGQMMNNTTGTPIIKTTWLLTRQTTPDNAWSSTYVGSDTFYPLPIDAKKK